MQSRFLKQVICGGFYLIILVAVGYSIYFLMLSAQASCFDNRRNQGETDIDCGGTCESCELKNIKPLRISPVLIFDNGDGTLSTLTDLKNPNENYGGDRFLYKLSFYGPDRTLLNSLTRESFIYPGEIKFIVEAGLNIDPKQVVRAGFEVSDLSWRPIQEFSLPKAQVRDIQTEVQSESRRVIVSGLLVNQNSFGLSKVTINVILFNKFSSETAVSKTSIENIQPSEERPFQVTVFGVDIPTLALNDIKVNIEAQR